MDYKTGFENKTISIMYFVRHMLGVGVLKLAKRAKIGQNEGQKFKIVNFEANFLFGTLQIDKWTAKVVL